jgi:hypothetical protein
MLYHYQAYHLPIISDIELPALLGTDLPSGEPLRVKLGPILPQTPGQHWTVPGVARYAVAEGKHLTIEPLGDDWDKIRLYFYSNALTMALFQRNLVPFHVSGVRLTPRKVLLFAAPSGTGKSTTALKLQEKGYPIFTDDTALLHIQHGQCFATASYPMVKLWQETIDQQKVYADGHKKVIYSEGEAQKFGYFFHSNFENKPMEVAGLVFLNAAGDEIIVESLDKKTAFVKLLSNAYRAQWLAVFNQQRTLFSNATQVINRIDTWQATRPEYRSTFEDFAEKIIDQIIAPIVEKGGAA